MRTRTISYWRGHGILGVYSTKRDKTRQDKTRQDKTRQDKTRQEKNKTRQDTTRHEKTRQNQKNKNKTKLERPWLDNKYLNNCVVWNSPPPFFPLHFSFLSCLTTQIPSFIPRLSFFRSLIGSSLFRVFFLLCRKYWYIICFFSVVQAEKMAIEEELAQTRQGLHDLTLRVEASKRCVRLVLHCC